MTSKLFSLCCGNEFEIMDAILQDTQELPYPLKTIPTNDGVDLKCYEIPEKDKKSVLRRLYPFTNPPPLDARLYDLHQDEMFTVRDFLVIRSDGKNYLVSPYYPQSGGTVLDWLEDNISDFSVNMVKEDTP